MKRSAALAELEQLKRDAAEQRDILAAMKASMMSMATPLLGLWLRLGRRCGRIQLRR